jgi:hypothetical protein
MTWSVCVDNILRQRLDKLPPLDSRAGRELSSICKLCRSRADLFDIVDFQKHCSFSGQYSFGLSNISVRYHRCRQCGFLFTTFFDDWSTADFARYIYNQDYVQIDPEYKGDRAERFAHILAELLGGGENLRILDYGSGAGHFVAAMRAAGFAYTEGFDPFSSPLRPQGRFDVVTCFEALEHTAWPDQTVADIYACLQPTGCLIFSQTVQPPDITDIRGAWWYLAPRNGHISMFTVEALHRLLPSPRHTLHSNGMLWVMAPPVPQGLLAEKVAKIGPAIIALSLRPPPNGADELWHRVEPSQSGPFRWSCADTLQWRLAAPPRLPARMALRIPFAMEIQPGFASGCTVDIGGVDADIAVSEREIFAEAWIDVAAPEITATLRTPMPISPFDLSGARDARRLGLGMVVE